MKISLKEVEVFAVASMWMGGALFVAICLFDVFVGVQVNHSPGYGWMQVLGMAASGLYTFWAWAINAKWNEYQKMIKGMME